MKRICETLYLIVLFIIIFGKNSYSTPSVKFIPKPVWVTDTKPGTSVPDKNDISEGSFLKLLETQVNVAEEAEYTHIIRKLMNETGVQNNSEINIEFDPEYQKLSFHNIRIIRDGNVIHLNKTVLVKVIQVESDLSRFIYNGTYTALIVLNDIRIGDELEYDYTLKGFNPVFNGRYSERFYFDGSDPVDHLYYSVIIPDNRELFVKSFNNAPEYTKTIIPTIHSVRYEWELNNVKAKFNEEFEPSWYNAYSRVQISETRDWEDLVNWAVSITPLNKLKEPAVLVCSAKIKSESKSTEDYTAKCVRFVQDEIRYMGIENGIYSHKPHSPSKVLTQRYGDCKDKSLLLCALLNAENIEAYPVYINTYRKGKTDEQLPAPTDFNHCVCLCILNTDSIYIDPTLSLQRGSLYNLQFPNYEKGLIIKSGQKNLVTIKDRGYGKTEVTETFYLGEINKPGLLNVRSVYTKADADNIRNYFQNNSINEIQINYLSYYNKIYNSLSTDKTLKYSDNESDGRLTLEEHYKIGKTWNQNKENVKRFSFTLEADYLKNYLTVLEKSERISPAELTFPCNIDYTIDVNTPEEWTINNEYLTISNPSFQFTFEATKKSTGFILHYQYKALKSYVASSDIEKYIKDIETLQEQLLYTISWNKDLVTTTSDSGWRLNFPYALLTIVITIILSVTAIRIYRISLPGYEEIQEQQIGSWLILPLIQLIISMGYILKILLTNDYFNETAIINLKSNPGTSDVNWDLLLLPEIAANLALLILCALCLFSFIKRRDITPRLMIAFYILGFIVVTGDHFLTAGIRHLQEDGGSENLGSIGRSLIGCIIWIPVFLKSERVRNTFVKPYEY